jgi:hypothetical protein
MLRPWVKTLVTAVSFCAVVVALAQGEGENLRVATLVPGPPSCPPVSPVRTAFERVIRQDGFERASFTRICFSELTDVPARVRQILETKPNVLVIWGSPVAARMAIDTTGTLPVILSQTLRPEPYPTDVWGNAPPGRPAFAATGEPPRDWDR